MDDTPSLIGDNLPPLDTPDQLRHVLERDYGALLDEAADLALLSYELPNPPKTDDESGEVADFILKLRRLSKRADEERLAVGKPYRDAQGVANRFFEGVTDPCEELMKRLSKAIDDYRRAREQRIRQQQELERRAELKRQKEAEEAAEALRKQSEAAAAASRQAAMQMEEAQSAEEIAAAETALREARRQEATFTAEAVELQHQANEAGEQVEALENAQLPGLQGATAAAVPTSNWTYVIEDEPALLKSLGPLGMYFGVEAIAKALRAAIREGVRVGVDGVRIYQATSTTIRSSKR
jgi:hypothetical protein